MIKEYSNVSQGDRLWFPTADENGGFLTDPASYWLSQPYHESFTQGWYWKNGIVVAMGNKNTIEMTFINSASPTVPTGYTLFEDTRDGANSASWCSRGYEVARGLGFSDSFQSTLMADSYRG